MAVDEGPLPRILEVFGHEFRIKQIFDGELGATVWDSLIILLKYIEANVEAFPLGFWSDKRVLDLGAGTGAAAVVLGSLHPKLVVATDQAGLLPLIKENAQLNNLHDKVRVVELEYGNAGQLQRAMSEGEPEPVPFDVILASDLIAGCYKEEYANLVQTLVQACSQETLVLIAHELRDREELEFFRLLKEHFEVKRVLDHELDEDWKSDDILIFRCTKNSES